MERNQRNECAMMRDGMFSHTEHCEQLIVIVIFYCSPLDTPVVRREVGHGCHRILIGFSSLTFLSLPTYVMHNTPTF